MKFAAYIRILFVLILALGFIDQHNNGMLSSAFAKQEIASHPAYGGNLTSHEPADVQLGDDLLNEILSIASPVSFILTDSITFLVPEPVLAGASPCWQPPEFNS